MKQLLLSSSTPFRFLVQKKTLKPVSAWRRYSHNQPLCRKSTKKNVGNCLIGLNMAFRMQADPLMVFQNLVVVSGVPSFEAKFAIACFNATGKYTPIDYQEIGTKGTDSYGMFATTINKQRVPWLKVLRLRYRQQKMKVGTLATQNGRTYRSLCSVIVQRAG